MEKKPGFIKKLLGLIKESIYHKKGGKVSSGRLSSYFILGGILFAIGVFIGIDIVNACVAIYSKGFYEIPANHLVLYGMTLAHHLALLGINKNAETQVEKAVQEKLKHLNELNPKDMPTIPPGDEEMNEEDMI